MILAETTVAVDYLRTPTPRLLKIIQDNQAGICGVTVAEIYAGAKAATDFARYAAALSVFGTVAIPDTIWEPLGRNLSTLLRNGITVPSRMRLLRLWQSRQICNFGTMIFIFP